MKIISWAQGTTFHEKFAKFEKKSSLGGENLNVRFQGPTRSARKSWGPWDPFLGPTSLCVGPEYGSQGVQLFGRCTPRALGRVVSQGFAIVY